MYDTLIDPKVLFEHLESSLWCVLDCRASLTDAAAGSQAYEAGHVPGALFADLANDLSGPIVPGVSGRHPLPDPHLLAATFGRWGIGAQTQVVAYDAANSALHRRAWWLLRWSATRVSQCSERRTRSRQAEDYRCVARSDIDWRRRFRSDRR
jgi:thiosulfate/3-mercaptopyruvate sulfurtransferase